MEIYDKDFLAIKWAVANNLVNTQYINVVNLFNKNKIQWDSISCSSAAYHGNLECLIYMYEKGCELDIFTCIVAAKNGHLDCLRYAHEQGCKWGSLVTTAASLNGHLDCLIYAHEEGCEWDKSVCSNAAE